jgi:hypothetical protein
MVQRLDCFKNTFYEYILLKKIFSKNIIQNTHTPLHNMTLNSSLEIIIKLPNSRCVI